MSIMTVNGKIDKGRLGITLPHEHMFIDFRMIYEKPSEQIRGKLAGEEISLRNLHVLRYHPFSLLDNLIIANEELVLSEIMEFKKAGGASLVDQTPQGLGQNPEAIRRVANAAGLQAVVGCGFYIRESLPKEILEASEEQLVNALLREVTEGVGGTSIRPGLIGEIGIGNDIGAWERKVLRVVARVQRETDLPISIHIQAVPTVPGFKGASLGLEVLSNLERAKANVQKVMISHTDAQVNLEYIKQIIDRGAYAEFDHVGKEFYIESSDFLMDRDSDRITALKQLFDSGYVDGILISQDVCLKTDLMSYGGYGYVHILENLVPRMRRLGVSEEVVRKLLIDNPARLLDTED